MQHPKNSFDWVMAALVILVAALFLVLIFIDPSSKLEPGSIRLDRHQDARREVCLEWIYDYKLDKYEYRCITLTRLRIQFFGD
jgi:hypothetical protein